MIIINDYALVVHSALGHRLYGVAVISAVVRDRIVVNDGNTKAVHNVPLQKKDKTQNLKNQKNCNKSRFYI